MIDENDLLRVGGRLHQSQLSREAKHPALLPKTHRISKLILEGQSDKYLASPPDGVTIAREICYRVVHSRSEVVEISAESDS